MHAAVFDERPREAMHHGSASLVVFVSEQADAGQRDARASRASHKRTFGGFARNGFAHEPAAFDRLRTHTGQRRERRLRMRDAANVETR